MKYLQDGEDLYEDKYLYDSLLGYQPVEPFDFNEMDEILRHESYLEDVHWNETTSFDDEQFLDQSALAEEIANMKTKPTCELYEPIRQDGQTHRINIGVGWHRGNGRIIYSSKIGNFESVNLPSEPVKKVPKSTPQAPMMISLAALNSVSEARVH